MRKLFYCFNLILVASVANHALGQETFQLDSTIRYDYINGDSVFSIKTIFLYNNNNQVIEELEQSWIFSALQWINQARTTTSYDGQLEDTITSWEFNDDQWIPSERTINKYDSLKRISENVTQVFDENAQILINKTRTIRNYQTDNFYTLKDSWDMERKRWMTIDSTISILNGNGQIESDTSFARLEFANSYIYAALAWYEYDTFQNLITQTRFEYSFDSLSFLPRSRDSFAYNQENFQILARFDIWNSVTKTWEPSLGIERKVNEDGRLSESTILFADFLTGILFPTSRLEYTYTNGMQRSEADSLLLKVKNFTFQGPVEIPDWKRHYYYSSPELTFYHDPMLLNRISVSPNPAQEYIQLNGDWQPIKYFKWLTMDGRLLSSGKVTGNKLLLPENSTPNSLLILIDRLGRPVQVEKIITAGL